MISHIKKKYLYLCIQSESPIMKTSIYLLCMVLVFMSSCKRSQGNPTCDTQTSVIVTSDLSNQRIKAFAEDSLGHIWIGTFRGLNRYNSLDFHQYFCTDSCIDLPDNQICNLFNDSNNRLWVATLNGIAIYYNNGHFLQIKNAAPPSYQPLQIIESKTKQIFVNYRNHLDKYDEESGELVTAMALTDRKDRSNIWCHFDRRNKLWVIDINNLRCYSPENHQLIDSIALSGTIKAHYMDTENDQLWLGGKNYLIIFDLRNRKMLQLPSFITNHPILTKANITNIYKYEDGYWLFNTSDHGLIVANSSNERIWKEDDPGYPFELPDFYIESFFTDSNKNLWVGSYDKGLAIINRFQSVFNSNIALHSFIHRRSVYSLDYGNDTNLWMATLFDGLYTYNMKTAEASEIKSLKFPGGSQPTTSISLVKTDKDGDLWLGSLLDNKVWKCKWTGKDLSVTKSYEILAPISIIKDSHGALWIGSGVNRIYRYNEEKDTFDGIEIGGTPNNGTFVSGLADGGDKIYVAAFDLPLLQAKYENQEIKLDTIQLPGWNKLIMRGHFMPSDLLYDSFGELWIGTVGNGLLHYNPDTKELSRIMNIPCTDISSLEEDKQGHIWISTQYGLYRYNRKSQRIQTYFANDGIGGNQFFDRSSVMIPGGMLIFGGTHGVTSFNPVNISSKNKMRLVWGDLKIHNTIIDPLSHPDNLISDLGKAKKINLNNGENSFSISFAALDFASRVKPRYSYILENYDPYWIEARNTNEASYSNLPPGNYTLHVRISDDSEAYEGEELVVDIYVSGNPWTSWWAITIYILIAMALIYFGYFHRKGISLKLEVTKDTDKNSKQGEEKEAVSPADQKLMQEFQGLLEKEIANPEIDINRIANIMCISRTKLYYKIKSITGQNPSVYVKTFRLERAAQLLREGKYSIGEIAEMTGFSTTAHFSTSFKNKYGKTPSEYAR